jgi:hypothetical protein
VYGLKVKSWRLEDRLMPMKVEGERLKIKAGGGRGKLAFIFSL